MGNYQLLLAKTQEFSDQYRAQRKREARRLPDKVHDAVGLNLLVNSYAVNVARGWHRPDPSPLIERVAGFAESYINLNINRRLGSQLCKALPRSICGSTAEGSAARRILRERLVVCAAEHVSAATAMEPDPLSARFSHIFLAALDPVFRGEVHFDNLDKYGCDPDRVASTYRFPSRAERAIEADLRTECWGSIHPLLQVVTLDTANEVGQLDPSLTAFVEMESFRSSLGAIKLSPNEKMIVEFILGTGVIDNNEISEALGMSLGVVKMCRHRIRRKASKADL